MNRQQFSEYIKNPGATNAQSLKMLEDLVKRYPYCQTSQILFAFNLLKEENLQFPLQLKKAAAYSGDRRKLKDLMESGKPKPIINPPEQVAPSEQILITEPPAEPEIVHSSIPEPTPEQIQAIKTEDFLPPHEKPIKDRMTPEELLEIVKKRLSEIKAGKDRGDTSSPVISPPFNPSKETITDKNLLIEKFIREEPKISKPKAIFFNPSDSAHQSNFDEEEIVSETLAQLYAKQGNIAKAIHTYEKLSLLNQEKSRYFASQIEKINNTL
ncbi:MAG: hypothetical protein PHF97_00550 [Bacteroidales bacterium]|nr:hypothetical protein [Bacteroidales bacterium]